MKFGLLTAILEGTTFEEAVDFAAENQLECLEVACWPNTGGAKRRYAGVCHIDAEALTEEKAKEIIQYCKERNVEFHLWDTIQIHLIGSGKRKQYIDHIYALIDASSMLNVNMVTTFLGRVPDKNVEENLEIVKEVWPPILEYAKEKVKYGVPLEADLVFDVRFMPNPYYVPELRYQTGMNDDVYNYVFSFPQTKEFLSKLEQMLAFLLPLYQDEARPCWSWPSAAPADGTARCPSRGQ